MFKLKEKNTTLKTEIIGGLITFVAMCYILPVNSTILHDGMGMNSAGVFAITALLSGLITILMGLIANYPIILSTGMGMNAFIAFTLSSSMGFETWQQKMILLTITGIIFFVLSLTPVRKKIIEAIPLKLRGIISASLGGFILFVGLKGSGFITSSDSTLVTLGNFLDPAMLISTICIFITIGLLFVKSEKLQNFAIPIGILSAAIVGILVSSIMVANGSLKLEEGSWIYKLGENNPLTGQVSNLPIAPWNDTSLQFGLNGEAIKDVFAFGLLSDGYSMEQFGQDIVHILATPASYIAIFSLGLVKLFESTATLISVGTKAGFIEENGEFKNYKRVIMVDAAGSLVSAPCGTSQLTPFVESNIGVSLGAKTGLMAVVTGLLFMLCSFLYPVFAIFTSGPVTAPALVAVGLMILVNSLKEIEFKNDFGLGVVAAITVIFTILTYSIPNGIGFGIISYIIVMLISRRQNEITVPLYVIAGLYIVSFILNTVIPLFA